jgi:STE24 endopeptidase
MHPTKLLAVSQIHLLAILALFPAFLKSPPLLLSFNFPPSVAQNPPVLLAFMLFQMVITPAEAVVGMLMNAVSRRFEWEADRFACELSVPEGDRVEGKEVVDMGGRLSNALISLHVENLSTVWVDWL